MKATCLAVLVGIGQNCFGQNLVQNPGFEEYTGSCSTGVGWLSLDVWEKPDCATGPPYYNACDVGGWGSGVPINDYGFQLAHGGDGYCSLITYQNDGLGFNGNPQTYISVDLLQPLQAGEEYCIRFWLNLADSSAYTTADMHAFLWYGLPSICNYNDTAWDTYAATTFNTTVVDSIGWHLMEGGFTASGGESNLTLGSFSLGPEIDTTLLGLGYLPYIAMYFIDDVYLGDCAFAGITEEGFAHELSIFPNPALRGQQVTVRCSCASNEHQWSMADLTGRAAWMGSWEQNTEELKLPTASIKPGAYVIHVEHADGTRDQVQLVIQ